MKNEIQTIALFGGSFDPPHRAHETIVKEALKIKDVEKVVVMPTFLNPFKSNSFAPPALRLKWLKCVFSKYLNVEINSFEVEKKEKVPSITTVRHLSKIYSKIYLIIGADNLEMLEQWCEYKELKTLVTFIIASRKQVAIPHSFLQIIVDEDISSTQIRKNMDKSKLSQECSSEIINFYKEKNEY